MSAYVRPAPYRGYPLISTFPLSATKERVCITLTAIASTNGEAVLTTVKSLVTHQHVELSEFVVLTRYGQALAGVLKFNEYATNGESNGLIGGGTEGVSANLAAFALDQGRPDFVYPVAKGNSLDLIFNDLGTGNPGDLIKIYFTVEKVKEA